MWREVQRLARLPITRKRLLGEALLALALARLAMFFLPFCRIAKWLGEPGAETLLSAKEAELHIANEIGWAVGVLARRVPWDGRCLAQALAANAMLRCRRLEGTVSFGASRDEGAKFAAHAWLRFGPSMVTGGLGHERFKIFTTFARKRP